MASRGDSPNANGTMPTTALLVALNLALPAAMSFVAAFNTPRAPVVRRSHNIAMSESGESAAQSAGSKSLEAKMAAWEATEEEQRKSTLGGNIPLVGMPGLPGRATRSDQPTDLDAFDVGMNISGLILFPLAIILATFPFWIGTIDVGDVGPPPTM